MPRKPARIPMYESAYRRMRARQAVDSLPLDELGPSLIGPLSTRTIAGQPMTPRDWAAIALAALDEAGASKTTIELVRVTLREELGIE